MTDKLRELLEDVRTDYYEGSGMAVYPNSFTKLRDEITELDKSKTTNVWVGQRNCRRSDKGAAKAD